MLLGLKGWRPAPSEILSHLQQKMVKSRRANRKGSRKSRKLSRVASEWNRKVMEVYREMKRKDPNTRLGDAMRKAAQMRKKQSVN